MTHPEPLQPANRRLVTEATADSNVARALTDPGSDAHAAFKAVGNATYVPESMEPINLARFVTGDGSDETAAVNAAAALAVSTGRGLFLPGGLIVTVAGVVNLRYVLFVRAEGRFKVDTAAGGRIDVGHTAATRGGNIFFFKRVEMVNPAHEGVALRIVGVKQAEGTIMYCDRLQVYADDSDPTTASTAYNRLTLGEIRELQMITVGAGSWITQTQFLGGDIRKVVIDGDYSPNEVTFWDTCLEGAELRINVGSRIRFKSVRGEFSRGNEARVWFGTRTTRCIVEDNHISNANTTRPKVVLVEDLGSENAVVSSYDHLYQRHDLLSLDAGTLMFDSACEIAVANITPGFNKLTLVANRNILDTGLIRVGAGSDADMAVSGAPSTDEANFNMSRLFFASDAASWRIKVSAFDINQQRLNDPAALDLGGSLSWNATNQEWDAAVNRYGCRVRVVSPQVAFVKFVANSSSTERSFSRLRLIGAAYGRSTDYLIERARKSMRRPLYQTVKPTQGVAPLGTVVQGPAGSWKVTGRADTTVSVAVAASAATVEVASAAGIAVDDVLGVLLADGTTYWGKVTALAGTSLTVSPAVPSAASVGSRVSAVRWT